MQVLIHFELRRRRSLTPALGWSASDNPGIFIEKKQPTLKEFLSQQTLSETVGLFENDYHHGSGHSCI